MRMPKIVSLPPELLHEIIKECDGPERCHLRATCKVLNEHADPIVFRHLTLYLNETSPLITEHQIIALATRSSKACEYTRDLTISYIPNGLRASEQSRPYFGECDDLRVYLPTAISSMRNMTRFKWIISQDDPLWLIDSLMQAVAHLPHLRELDFKNAESCTARIPLGVFSNLSKLSVQCGQYEEVSSFISQMSIVIANSPQLKSLEVFCIGLPLDHPIPTLSDLFANLSAKKTLCIEHLIVEFMDATLDQVTLPHLTQLTSFEFLVFNRPPVSRSVWTSFLVNNIRLTDVVIGDTVTEEVMLYLSSFSGLKRVHVDFDLSAPDITENLKNIFFAEVLPKHVNSLETLKIWGDFDDAWLVDQASLESIITCLKLHELDIEIDGEESGMSVQRLLDAVSHLPDLKVLGLQIRNPQERMVGLANFKPRRGLRYVEELECETIQYVLEMDGELPVRYREIS